MSPWQRLEQMQRIGRRGQMKVKGNYENSSPRRIFEVIDEVSEVFGDTRFALERIRFDDGSYAIRSAYWTIEGRLRVGERELRVGFGQFSPILQPDVFLNLAKRALRKGWFRGVTKKSDALAGQKD